MWSPTHLEPLQLDPVSHSFPMKRIAIIGGGIAGLTAAYELARPAATAPHIEGDLYEAPHRLGGIVETVPDGGFIVECGPDAWVTGSPGPASSPRARPRHELILSNDATRRTYIILQRGKAG